MRYRLWWRCEVGHAGPEILILAVLLTGGCEIFSNPPPVESGGPSLDTAVTSHDSGGGDSGGHDSGGGDSGGGDSGGHDSGGGDSGGHDSGGGDSGDTGGFDCSRPVPPQHIVGDCVTLPELACGDTITSTTKDGTTNMGYNEYLAWYCFLPDSSSDYAGPERVFAFTHPGTGDVKIKLSSPCGEMDLAVVHWEYWNSDQECPTASHTQAACDAASTDAGDDEVTVSDTRSSHYLVIVDTRNGTPGPFQLSVDCP